MGITHAFVSTKLDASDTSLVRASNWNAEHDVEGLVDGASLSDYGGVCDGVTDNTDALTNALADSSIAALYIPEGVCNVTLDDGGFSVPSTLKRIWGPGRVKLTGSEPSSPTDQYLFYIAGSTGGLVFEIAEIEVSASSFPDTRVVYVATSSNVHIRNTRLIGAGHTGISFFTVTDSSIVGVSLTAAAHCNIFASGADDNIFSGIHSVGALTQTHHNIDISGNRNIISGSLIDVAGLFGIHVQGEDNKIDGNTVTGTKLEGIQIGAGSVASARNEITNNTLTFDANSTDFGISLDGTSGSGLGVAASKVSGNKVYNPAGAGIALWGDVTYALVSDNYVYNAHDRASLDAGISLLTVSSDPPSNNRIQGNRVVSDDADMAYGYKEVIESGSGNPNNNAFVGNASGGHTASPTVLLGTGSYAELLLTSYAKASLPAPVPAAQMIYISDATGGAEPFFSDGVVWRRVTDRSTVS
jgi:hypothetical protein